MKPKAVLISDVHYNVHTLKLADAAMRMAIDTANSLDVPLIVAGDLHDTKANIRAECVNAMRETFKLMHKREYYDGEEHHNTHYNTYIIRGNHDAINEKSEDHSLNFLTDLADIIEKPWFYNELGAIDGNSIHLIPYHHDTNVLKSYLSKVDKGSMLIMHQGITGSNSGDYIQDKSAITPQDVAGFNVISGHYHNRQTIQLPEGGTWNYIGNPYTLNYGEANDPPKGYQILMDDGTLKFVPTDLRKHVVFEFFLNDIPSVGIGTLECGKDDLVWIKIKGTKEDLARINKSWVAKDTGLESFRLDLIPLETCQVFVPKNLTQGPLLDSLVDGLTNTSDERKARLKQLWRDLV